VSTQTAPRTGTTQFLPQGIFSAEALETNRAGRLTDLQRRQFGSIDRNWRKSMVGLAAGLVIIALLLLSSSGPAPNAWMRPFAGAAFLAIAVGMVLYAMPTRDPLARDLRSGSVVILEGAMEKHSFSTHSGNSSVTSHYLDVADKHLGVSEAEYDAAPQVGIVRVFYLPRSRKVVNLERLADRPLASGATTAPIATLMQVEHNLRSSNGEAHHEAMAEMMALGNAVKAERAAAAVPPPVEQRDPRPLAEAIIGSWRAGPMAVSFAADGTMQLTTFGGRTQQGRWSVDGDGRLHADALGHDEAGDAWVAGDRLTVAVAGMGMSFARE
jgi:hypothetical protein